MLNKSRVVILVAIMIIILFSLSPAMQSSYDVKSLVVVHYKDGTVKTMEIKRSMLFPMTTYYQNVKISGWGTTSEIDVYLVVNVKYTGEMSNYHFTGAGHIYLEGNGKTVPVQYVAVDSKGTSFQSGIDVTVFKTQFSGETIDFMLGRAGVPAGNYNLVAEINSLSLEATIGGTTKTYSPDTPLPVKMTILTVYFNGSHVSEK